MRRVARWATDWRNGATLVAAILSALLVLSYLDARADRQSALDELAKRADQIEVLTDRIAELEATASENGAVIESFRRQIEILSEQVRQLGGDPVVVVDRQEPSRPSTSTTSTTAPSRPPPSTTTTTAPPDDPPRCRIPIPLLCGGAQR